VRREVYQTISREAGRALPIVAAERNYALLETLLELTLSGDRDAVLPNYVAFHLCRTRSTRRSRTSEAGRGQGQGKGV